MSRNEEIKAREQAAALGPWVGHYEFQQEKEKRAEFGIEVGIIIRDLNDMAICLMPFELAKDAEFILNAREDIPYLLDENNRLATQIEALVMENTKLKGDLSQCYDTLAEIAANDLEETCI